MEQQIFDIKTGMPVYGGNGQVIGTVTETAGFGSTRIDPTIGPANARVTQAQSGTGYFKVERPDREELIVPFHGIEEVIPEQGVYLTSSMLEELRCGDRTLAGQSDVTAQPHPRGGSPGKRGRWILLQPDRWRPRARALWGSEGKKAIVPVNVERKES